METPLASPTQSPFWSCDHDAHDLSSQIYVNDLLAERTPLQLGSQEHGSMNDSNRLVPVCRSHSSCNVEVQTCPSYAVQKIGDDVSGADAVY